MYPVSYTHLPDNKVRLPQVKPAFGKILFHVFRQEMPASVPVSYTHLDVYKRQATNKRCLVNILETLPQAPLWKGHLHIAMAPTKNMRCV